MAGYTRQDTANNIANGNVIDADDFDAEFNAIEAAFNSSTGHTHNGDPENGPRIQVFGVSGQLDGSASNLLKPNLTNQVDLGADDVRFKDAYLSGNASIGGNLTVTGNATIKGNLTFGDAATDTVAFGADINSSIIPDIDDTYDLGSATQQWRNLYIDGTANIDSLVADTADINGGTLDGVTIGGTTAGDITGLTITGETITSTQGFSGDLVGNVTGDLAGNASTASKWQTARTVTFSGDVSGSFSIDGSANVNGIVLTVADDSHNHTIANVDGLQTALDGKQPAGTYNTVIGTDTDINTSGSTIIDNIFVTDGVITSMGTRTLTLGDLGYTGATDADNYNNWLLYTDGVQRDTISSGEAVGFDAGPGVTLSWDQARDITISHADTSTQGTVNNSGNTVIQDIFLDDYGHVTFIGSKTLSINDDLITISAGGGLTGGGSFTLNQNFNKSITVSHSDTSSQPSVNNSGANFIQDITLDGYGHVTGVGSASVTDLFPASLGALGSSGYLELPNGLIINWGRLTGSSGAVTFAKTFPNNAIGGVATIDSANTFASGNYGCYIGNLSTTGASVAADSDGATGTPSGIFWLVWGR